MAALDFPASSSSPFTAPDGTIYTWVTSGSSGYWEAAPTAADYLKLDASNDPVTGQLELSSGFKSTGTGADRLQSGTVAQRPTGLGSSDAGYTRFNTDTDNLEQWTGTAWTVPLSIQDGSYTNNIITWQTEGGVLAWSTTGNGGTTSGTISYSYASQATTVVTGNGNGDLTVGYTKAPNGDISGVFVNNPGAGYAVGDTFSFTVPLTSAVVTGTIDTISNITQDGWYAEPGIDYFVSAKESSTYNSVPTFIKGFVAGKNSNFSDEQYALGSLFRGAVDGRANATFYASGNNITDNLYAAGTATFFKYSSVTDASATRQSSLRFTDARAIELATYDSAGTTETIGLTIRDDGTLSSPPTYNNTASQSSNLLRVTSGGLIQRSTSSRRYKNNIRDVALTNSAALDIVDQLQPRNWEDHETGETVAGLVAEEVFATAGEAYVSFTPWSQEIEEQTGFEEDGTSTVVTRTIYPIVGNGEAPVTKDGEALSDSSEVVDGLDNGAINLLLLQSIKELKAQNEALVARIEALEA